jgi:hypothetical protein
MLQSRSADELQRRGRRLAAICALQLVVAQLLWVGADAFDADSLRYVTLAVTIGAAGCGIFGGLSRAAPSPVLAAHMLLAGVCLVQHVLFLVEALEMSPAALSGGGRGGQDKGSGGGGGGVDATVGGGGGVDATVVSVCATIICTTLAALPDSFALFNARYALSHVRDTGSSGVFWSSIIAESRGGGGGGIQGKGVFGARLTQQHPQGLANSEENVERYPDYGGGNKSTSSGGAAGVGSERLLREEDRCR